jgi:hypothetical protein
MAQFGQAVGLPAGPAAPPPGAGPAPETAAMLAHAEENMRFWMEHEFRQYPAYHPHLDALAAAGNGMSTSILLQQKLVRRRDGKLNPAASTPKASDPYDGCARAGGTESLAPVEGAVVEHPAAVWVAADLEPLGCAVAS